MKQSWADLQAEEQAEEREVERAEERHGRHCRHAWRNSIPVWFALLGAHAVHHHDERDDDGDERRHRHAGDQRGGVEVEAHHGVDEHGVRSGEEELQDVASAPRSRRRDAFGR